LPISAEDGASEELSSSVSALREDFRPDSDVDVLVRFSPEARWACSI